MILNDALDRLGPAQTPRGTWLWSVELPMEPNNLLLSASLVCSEGELRAQVCQQEKESLNGWSDEVFGASWERKQGVWLFRTAHKDGEPVSETVAIDVFGRYVAAMAVESQFQEPLVSHAPRRKMGVR